MLFRGFINFFIYVVCKTYFLVPVSRAQPSKSFTLFITKSFE